VAQDFIVFANENSDDLLLTPNLLLSEAPASEITEYGMPVARVSPSGLMDSTMLSRVAFSISEGMK